MYWAEALADQSEDSELKSAFEGISNELKSHESEIVNELNEAQGDAVDLGGYYFPNPDKVAKAMRPSSTFNGIIKSI